MAELTTAVTYRVNIVHVLLSSQELGRISKEQRAGRLDVRQTWLVEIVADPEPVWPAG